MMDLLLDLANIVGGFLLAAALLRRLPRIGSDLARVAAAIAPFGWVVGIVALVAGGYFLIVHLTSGPHVFHFEVVGIAVGVALLWDRITGRAVPRADERGDVTGLPLLLAIFGIIAMIVGVEGIFTPN
jgi:fucose permease